MPPGIFKFQGVVFLRSLLYCDKKAMKIKEIGLEDRPREKMLRQGSSALTNSELLAIMIRTGTGRHNALDIAHEVMTAGEGRLSGVLSLGIDGLKRIDGIGDDKAVSILAALETGRRYFEENSGVDARHITSPEEIYLLMIPVLKNLDHEEAWVLFLSSRHRLIRKEKLSSGGDISTFINCKDVVRKALECKAASVVLVHNHPSGIPEPGKEDVTVTELLHNSLRVMNIRLLDHVIVSDGCYFSFADDGVQYL